MVSLLRFLLHCVYIYAQETIDNVVGKSNKWILEIEPLHYRNNNSFRWSEEDNRTCCCEGCPDDINCTACDNYFIICLLGGNQALTCRFLDANLGEDEFNFSFNQTNNCSVQLPFTLDRSEVRF